MKKRFYVFVILLFLSFSPVPSNAQFDNEWQHNFDLDLYILKSPHRETIANYIKGALYPLGIDVNIQFTRGNVFVTLLQGTQLIDGTIFRAFSEIQDLDPILPIPQGHSSQDYFVGDPPYQDIIDAKVEEILVETDMQTYITKYNEYREFYLDNVLDQIPLIQEKNYLFYPKELIGLEPGIGFGQSILNGMHWDNTVSEQKKSTIRMNEFWDVTANLDPSMYYFQNAMAALVKLDPDLVPHPDLAITWERNDWTLETGEIIKDGKHTFVLRDDAYWKQTIPSILGTYSDFTHKISPQDFGFGFDMFRPLINSSRPAVKGTEIVDKRITTFSHYEINDTANSISFYNRYPSAHDIVVLSNLTPLPEFHLNQTIVYNSTLSMNPYDMLKLTDGSDHFLVPFEGTSMQDFFGSSPISAGPFEWDPSTNLLQNDEIIANFREDYWWPNEWDSPNQDFILHEEGSEEPYFFNYNSTISNPTQKPTKPKITRIESPFYTSFENGDLDVGQFIAGFYSLDQIIDLLKNPNFIHQEYYTRWSGQSLFFNIANPDIGNVNVRKAIASAIDRSVLVDAYNGQFEELTDINWQYTGFYTDMFMQKFPYDYSLARDLMRNEGYWAREKTWLGRIDTPTQTTTTVPKVAPINPFSLFLALIISVHVVKRRRLII